MRSQSASQPPDQSGQELAWSLGAIGGFERASVTLTVSLASVMPTQLDTGAHALATVDAAAVSAAAPAPTLAAGGAPTDAGGNSLLESKPDAAVLAGDSVANPGEGADPVDVAGLGPGRRCGSGGDRDGRPGQRRAALDRNRKPPGRRYWRGEPRSKTPICPHP
jgi:hypothetical protein